MARFQWKNLNKALIASVLAKYYYVFEEMTSLFISKFDFICFLLKLYTLFSQDCLVIYAITLDSFSRLLCSNILPTQSSFYFQRAMTKQNLWLLQGWSLNPICTGLFLHPICTGGGGKFASQSKNCLVSDRSKVFCMLKLFFIKFLKIKILRLWRHANYDVIIKSSKSL